MVSLGEYNYGIYNGGFYNQGYDPDIFSFNPDFVWPLEVHMLTVIEEKEDGTEKRITKMPWPIRIYEASFLAQTDAQKELFEDFFENRKASRISFSYTDPVENIERTVRFEDETLELRKRPDTLWDINVKLRQVQ